MEGSGRCIPIRRFPVEVAEFSRAQVKIRFLGQAFAKTLTFLSNSARVCIRRTFQYRIAFFLLYIVHLFHTICWTFRSKVSTLPQCRMRKTGPEISPRLVRHPLPSTTTVAGSSDPHLSVNGTTVMIYSRRFYTRDVLMYASIVPSVPFVRAVCNCSRFARYFFSYYDPLSFHDLANIAQNNNTASAFISVLIGIRRLFTCDLAALRISLISNVRLISVVYCVVTVEISAQLSVQSSSRRKGEM